MVEKIIYKSITNILIIIFGWKNYSKNSVIIGFIYILNYLNMIKVNSKKKIFLLDEQKIELSYQETDKFFYFDANLFSDKFREYQKNLFNDMFSKVLELNEKYDNFVDFKKWLETEIKQFNLQLRVFQEKVNLENKIEIRGSLQIIRKENYISVLIWETSLIIVRKWKLESVIINEIDDSDQIDIFSEIIEWELEDKDKIIQINCNIYNYLSDWEIKEAIQTDDIIYYFSEILTTVIDEKEIWFINILDINIEKSIIIKEKKDIIFDYKKNLEKYKYPIAIISAIIVIVLLIMWIFSYISKPDTTKIVTTVNWKKVVLDIDINTLKRDIDAFSKLNDTNTEIAKQQYDKIMTQLNKLEKAKIQVLEVKELRKKMEQLYFKWFHINIITENDWLLKNIYSFWDKEIKQLSWMKQLIYTNWFLNVIWNKWVILWIVSKKFKWILQQIKLPTNINVCTVNLSKNWVYCVLDNNTITNISKYWISSLKNLSKRWPNNIVGINIYGNNKLYLLTDKSVYSGKNSYITRYVLQGKNLFWKPTNYIFEKNTDKKIINWIYTGSTLAIDWSFLIWTKNWLSQAYRKDSFSVDMSARIIDWRNKAIVSDKDLMWKVKTISLQWDKYVYLYDYNTSSLIVYLTTPYKTNDSYTTSYKLKYLFKVKFDLNDNVVDALVVYNSSQNLRTVYILTTKNIYSFHLEEFMTK